MIYRPVLGSLLILELAEPTPNEIVPAIQGNIRRARVIRVSNEGDMTSTGSFHQLLDLENKIIHFDRNDARELTLNKEKFLLLDQLSVLIVEEDE